VGIHIMPPLYKMVIVPPGPAYGPPVTVKFYPTPGSDGVAADGRADRTKDKTTWGDIRGGAGTTAFPAIPTSWIGFTCGGDPNTWYILYRTLLHFDTLLLPAGCLIDAAKIGLSGYWKSNTIPSTPSLALVESVDPTPGDITPADYQNLNTAILAPKIAFDDFSDVGWNVFTLPESSFEFIIRAGITKFGLREGNYDCPNIEPPYNRYKTSTFRVSMRDDIEAHWPYLEVTYRPLL